MERAAEVSRNSTAPDFAKKQNSFEIVLLSSQVRMVTDTDGIKINKIRGHNFKCMTSLIETYLFRTALIPVDTR